MASRGRLLSSTFLASLACGFIASGAVAADSLASPPAVDGVNGKIEALGGSYDTKGLYGAAGSLSIPLASQFGAQLDAGAGSFANRFIGSLGGHLFWRDPRYGLVGLYGSYTDWDQYGGVHVSRVAGEGEAYFGRWTLSGVAGVETGNNSSTTIATSSTSAIPGPGTVTSSAVTTQLTDVTRFFDRVNLSYYLTDDWKATIGHRYVAGRHALALGTEYAMAAGRGVMSALFVEARLGEGDNNYGVWGGVRFYFGNSDKSLMRRNREDDPEGVLPPAETLTGLAGSLGPSSTSTSAKCPTGEVFLHGVCASPSDIRLKRDVALLARLDNGIGLYRYRYLWSDIVYVGVMAQEVADIVPDAVMVADDGYYRVNYARLGLRLMTWDEWTQAVALPYAA